MAHDIRTLVSKLNGICREALEGAAELCVAETNYHVEIEHLLTRLVEAGDSDIRRALAHFSVKPEAMLADLRSAIDGFERGATSTPALSPHLPALLSAGWNVSSLELGGGKIRSGALLLALLQDASLRALVTSRVPALGNLSADRLKAAMDEIGRNSIEQDEAAEYEDAKREAAGLKKAAEKKSKPRSKDTPLDRARAKSKTPTLDEYAVDLTEEARAGRIDPIVGRDGEIRQVIDVLCRRRQNNPILTGEAGVGKTAVVEGFALRVAEGDVPPPLRDVAVRSLDIGLLQAGAGVRGEFEERLSNLIDEIKGSAQPIILFIDEAHMLIGAGGAAGSQDAANLLKPALARGELRTIAATTWAEYKQYIEKDPALTRRFQVVRVDEPDVETAIAMMRGVADKLAQHHGVEIEDEAVREAVRLSHRYITGRQLPDKCIGVLDTAAARVALARAGEPPELEDARREIQRLETEIAVARRSAERGVEEAGHRLKDYETALGTARSEQAELEKRWAEEAALVKEIEAAGDPPPADRLAALHALQGDSPLVPMSVDARSVANVVAGWTGVPVGRMVTDEIDAVLELERRLGERVVGQEDGLRAIARRVATYRADLGDPGRPVGVFLLVGPSGVGKTETALAIADLLYGGERQLVTVNLSEYQESHSVAKLKGAPPGYVGYGKGGVLTEAVRRNPYCVVLLDEVEKAHPDIMEAFYQVFDRGFMEDGEGLEINFSNVLFLLTSNLATDAIMEACADGVRPDPDSLIQRIRPELVRHFKPALLGRMTIAPYYPLGQNRLRDIVELKLEKIVRRFRERRRAELRVEPSLVDHVAALCAAPDAGAREIDRLLTNGLLPDLSAEVLRRMAERDPFTAVDVTLDPAGGFAYRFVNEGA
jgi:type VI secretion system protein VasG